MEIVWTKADWDNYVRSLPPDEKGRTHAVMEPGKKRPEKFPVIASRSFCSDDYGDRWVIDYIELPGDIPAELQACAEAATLERSNLQAQLARITEEHEKTAKALVEAKERIRELDAEVLDLTSELGIAKTACKGYQRAQKMYHAALANVGKGCSCNGLCPVLKTLDEAERQKGEQPEG